MGWKFWLGIILLLVALGVVTYTAVTVTWADWMQIVVMAFAVPGIILLAIDAGKP